MGSSTEPCPFSTFYGRMSTDGDRCSSVFTSHPCEYRSALGSLVSHACDSAFQRLNRRAKLKHPINSRLVSRGRDTTMLCCSARSAIQ